MRDCVNRCSIFFIIGLGYLLCVISFDSSFIAACVKSLAKCEFVMRKLCSAPVIQPVFVCLAVFVE